MFYELIIIGGGPGGVAAGVYAARKKIKTALITDIIGGQSLVSSSIENWIGTKSIDGAGFGAMLEEHLREHKDDIDVFDGDKVIQIEKISDEDKADTPRFRVKTETGKEFDTATILLVAGSRRRRLNVPGEEKFEGHGVAYCAVCDAPLFKGKDMVVIGGGNSALESVVDLFPYAKKIYLLHRRDHFKGDPVTLEKIKSNKEQVEIIKNVEIDEILGDKMVEGLRYREKESGQEKTISVQGVFVEIGSLPNSEIVADFVEMNDWREVKVNHRNQRTATLGLWAAGDVTDLPYKQNNISTGDSIKALLDIYDFLKVK